VNAKPGSQLQLNTSGGKKTLRSVFHSYAAKRQGENKMIVFRRRFKIWFF